MLTFTKHLTFVILYLTDHNSTLLSRNYYPHFQMRKPELREAVWLAEGHTASSVPHLVSYLKPYPSPDHFPHCHQRERIENPSLQSSNASLLFYKIKSKHFTVARKVLGFSVPTTLSLSLLHSKDQAHRAAGKFLKSCAGDTHPTQNLHPYWSSTS